MAQGLVFDLPIAENGMIFNISSELMMSPIKKKNKERDKLTSQPIVIETEYKPLLTKLTGMAFVLGVDYAYILKERKKQRTNLQFSEAERFVNSVSYQFEKKVAIGDHMIIESIQNWDNLGIDTLLASIDQWISEYILCCLQKSRIKEVEKFLDEQEDGWVKSLSKYRYFSIPNNHSNMKKTTRGRSQDRAKVAAGQEHEVKYEKEKLNVPGEEVKKAVKSEGNSRKKVEEKLKK